MHSLRTQFSFHGFCAIVSDLVTKIINATVLFDCIIFQDVLSEGISQNDVPCALWAILMPLSAVTEKGLKLDPGE